MATGRPYRRRGMLSRLGALGCALVAVGTVTAAAGPQAARTAHGVRTAVTFPALPASAGSAADAGLQALLARRATAVLHHDRAGWLATVDTDTPAAAAGQAAEYDRIAALPVTQWQYRPAGVAPVTSAARTAGATTGPGSANSPAAAAVPVPVPVALTYRLAGDTRDVVRTRTLTVKLGGMAGWRVVSETAAADTDRDLWDLAPVTVARAARGVSVGLGAAPSEVAALAARIDTAAASVDALWGPSWPRQVAVVLPGDASLFQALLEHPAGAAPVQFAAVTTGWLDRGRSGPHAIAAAADRVVLNPDVWARLTDAGRQAVLVHELTHVATRATTSATPPTWLDEGFAAWVGYRDAGLTGSAVAADALPAVRAGRLPPALPADGDFDPARGDAGPAYAQAWVACDLIAERAGPAGLVAAYRAAASGGGGPSRADAALRQVLGEDTATFTTRWQARLRTLAGAGA
jgi:hypothetical protein